eukprot:5127820-Pyramimonas_sp.AAC.1
MPPRSRADVRCISSLCHISSFLRRPRLWSTFSLAPSPMRPRVCVFLDGQFDRVRVSCQCVVPVPRAFPAECPIGCQRYEREQGWRPLSTRVGSLFRLGAD